jgi:MFS family permease
MIAAIAAAQFAALIADRGRSWRPPGSPRPALAVRLLLPHATAAVVVWLLQVTLPTTVVPQYDGTSITNVWRLADRHVKNLAEVSGLKRPWERQPTVFGSTTVGWIAVVVYLLAAGAGVALAVVRNRDRLRDLHLVGYAAVAFVIGGSFRVAINRYVCTVGPILLLLGASALYAGLRTIPRRWVATTGVTIVLAAIVAGNLANANIRVRLADEFADAGNVEWGPTHPDAIAMFDEVRLLTDGDDVVAAPKARAMTLETGRPSVQVDDARPIPDDVDIALVVVERTAKLATELRNDPSEYTLVWENPRFALFEPTTR